MIVQQRHLWWHQDRCHDCRQERRYRYETEFNHDRNSEDATGSRVVHQETGCETVAIEGRECERERDCEGLQCERCSVRFSKVQMRRIKDGHRKNEGGQQQERDDQSCFGAEAAKYGHKSARRAGNPWAS